MKLTAVLLLSAVGGWCDRVTLKNGDRVSGSIVKKDSKTLTIKTEFMGTIALPWEQVDLVQSTEPLIVQLNDRTVTATIESRDGKIVLKEQDEAIESANVIAIRNQEEQRAYERLIDPGWLDLWAGAAGLGFAGAQGNAQTRTFTAAMNAARITNTDKTSAYFNLIRASAMVSGIKAETAEAVRGGWAYNHNLSPRVFFNGFNDYEYDRFQNLDLRFVLGGGLGFVAWKAERGRLDLLGGAAYNREKFSPMAPAAPFSRNSAEAYWGNDFTMKLNNATTVLQSFRMFNNLSDRGAYRMNGDLGASTRIARWLTWNIGLSDRFLSNPVPGRKKNDFLYTTGLGITFAR